MRFEFVINARAAKALDLTIPQSILLRGRGHWMVDWSNKIAAVDGAG